MPTFQSDVKALHSADGTLIYAEATGEPHKPHVVLLAGLSLSGCIYDDLCANPRLLETLYIVRYDLRGHGRSGKPITEEAYQSKMFADDFKTGSTATSVTPEVVAYLLYTVCNMRLRFRGQFWPHAAVATDVAAHLPPGTLSGVIYLAGVPCTGDLLNELAASTLRGALPGLLSNDNVVEFQKSAAIFTEKLFARPDTVPYKVKCLYMGHSLSPEIMALTLSRPMDVEKLWMAGREGLPLLLIHGTEDRHRKGGGKTAEEVLKPCFRNFECVWLEGRGHALHYECQEDIVRYLIEFTQKFGGKDYTAP